MIHPGPPPSASSDLPFLRGEVYLIEPSGIEENKYYLVVSNNARNSHLGTALMVRITTSVKPEIASIIILPHGECVSGRVLCDDIEEVWSDQVVRRIGALSISTMAAVNEALKSALGLS
ncbi:type II toxin-antitoxin system PemK/MazF family toxin [Micrococcaceae bacterium Sec5.7]